MPHFHSIPRWSSYSVLCAIAWTLRYRFLNMNSYTTFSQELSMLQCCCGPWAWMFVSKCLYILFTICFILHWKTNKISCNHKLYKFQSFRDEKVSLIRSFGKCFVYTQFGRQRKCIWTFVLSNWIFRCNSESTLNSSSRMTDTLIGINLIWIANTRQMKRQASIMVLFSSSHITIICS